jgi:hypothetical protein
VNKTICIRVITVPPMLVQLPLMQRPFQQPSSSSWQPWGWQKFSTISKKEIKIIKKSFITNTSLQ